MVVITDLFNPEELTETNEGFKTVCSDCGLQGNRTEGFILFPETNTSYCHSSHKWFSLLQTAGLKLNVIKCIEGNEEGEKPELDRETIKEIYDSVEENFGKEFLTDLKIACGDINNFLIIKVNAKGIETKTVNIDKVADYIISKFKIKTVFGLKEESLYLYENGIWTLTGKGILISDIEKLLQWYAKNNVVKEIFDKVKRKTECSRDKFDIVPEFKTPVLNGVLDLSDVDDLKFLPQNEKYNFKKSFPVEYNPKAKCPKILKFFKQTFYECDLTQVQEYGGLHLIRRYLFKKANICQGLKNTGKSVYLNLLSTFCGKKNISGLSLQKISHGKSFDLLVLKDAFANIHDDLSSGDLSDSGGFKMAVGDGDICGEQKFGDYIRFRNTAKQTYACNMIPSVKNIDDEAYYERWLVWNFENVILQEEMNPHLIDELTTKEELSGLLNWYIEGFIRLVKQNGFSNEKSCEETKELMINNSNPLAKFSSECLGYSQGKKITKEEMYNAYCLFCTNQKPILSPDSKIKIGNSLIRFASYISDAKSGNKRYWLNVIFKGERDNFSKSTSKYLKEGKKRDIEINNINSENLSHLPQIKHKTINSKPKSDREVQFYDAKECEDINCKCLKKDVEIYLLSNPDSTDKQLYDKFGDGCFKFKEELKKDKKTECNWCHKKISQKEFKEFKGVCKKCDVAEQIKYEGKIK